MTPRRPRGGGGARNPNSLANLRNGGTPAPVGNRHAVAHGRYAQLVAERVEAKVAEVFDALASDAPMRAADGTLPTADGALVRLAAASLCRLEDLEAHLRDHGIIDRATGNVRPAVDLERRLRAEALGLLDALGMTPTSRARLGLDLTRTASLAELMAQDAELEAREALGDVVEGDANDA